MEFTAAFWVTRPMLAEAQAAETVLTATGSAVTVSPCSGDAGSGRQR